MHSLLPFICPSFLPLLLRSPVFGLRYPKHPRVFWKTKTEDGGSLVFSLPLSPPLTSRVHVCARGTMSGKRKTFSYDIFVHGSKCQFIDGINLNLTHVCVCCEIIFVFIYIALVVFVYKVKKKKKKKKILPKMSRMGFEPTPYEWRAHRCIDHSTTA